MKTTPPWLGSAHHALPPPFLHSQATEALRITAPELIKFGIMDEIVPEPLGGSHADPTSAFPNIKEALLRNFEQ